MRRQRTITIQGPAREAIPKSDTQPFDIPARPQSRDHGKVFVITELPADQAEWWATRALLALTNAGAELPAGVAEAGMAGLAVMGVNALSRLHPADVKPLLDEMMACVKYVHRPGTPPQEIFDGEESQIEEVATRVELRKAVLELHLGFSEADAPQTTASHRGRVAAA
jgi:hypothetical protein